MISRNDKKEQLSKRKLALTAINKLFAHKIIGAPTKFKNQPRPLIRPSSVNLSNFFYFMRKIFYFTVVSFSFPAVLNFYTRRNRYGICDSIKYLEM